MSNYKTVFFILGILQIILGVSMIFPIITQFIFEELDSSFISASIITVIFGILFLLSNESRYICGSLVEVNGAKQVR